MLLKTFELRRTIFYFDELLIVRTKNWNEFYVNFCIYLQMFNMNPIKAKLFEVIVVGAVFSHWIASMFYIIPTYSQLLFSYEPSVKSWIVRVHALDDISAYIDSLFRSVSLLISKSFLLLQLEFN